MSNSIFRKVLLKFAAPPLMALGYEYDDSVRDRNIDYGFSKHLGDNIWAQITFQRHQDNEVPYGYGFTVNIDRHQAEFPGRWLGGNYDGGFSARLPHLIVDAFGLRIYPRLDYWWEAETEEELQQTMSDAVDKVEKYGVLLLEDKQFRYVGSGVGVKAWNVFQEILNKVVPVELSMLGYERHDNPIQYWTSARATAQQNLIKSLGDNLNAIITFHPLARFSREADDEPLLLMGKPKFHHFGILIARKHSTDPNAEISDLDTDCFQGWLGPQPLTRSDVKAFISESALWEYVETPGALYEYDAAAGTVIWKYPDNVRESLIQQLRIAVDKFRRDGMPMLENLQ